jgi:hypothetical protein
MRPWAAVLTGFACIVLLGCAGRSDNARASSFEEIKLVSWGSSLGSPSDAPCDLASFANTLSVNSASRELAWDLCEPTASGAEQQTDLRSLQDADLASINAAVGRLMQSDRQSCGADAPVVTLDERTSEGVQLLADDFYSGCPWGPLLGRTFVDGIGTLESTLNTMKDK